MHVAYNSLIGPISVVFMETLVYLKLKMYQHMRGDYQPFMGAECGTGIASLMFLKASVPPVYQNLPDV